MEVSGYFRVRRRVYGEFMRSNIETVEFPSIKARVISSLCAINGYTVAIDPTSVRLVLRV